MSRSYTNQAGERVRLSYEAERRLKEEQPRAQRIVATVHAFRERMAPLESIFNMVGLVVQTPCTNNSLDAIERLLNDNIADLVGSDVLEEITARILVEFGKDRLVKGEHDELVLPEAETAR